MDVTLNGKPVGTVECIREGLYCRILCRCTLPGQEIRRLYAGNGKIGVLMPQNGQWILETRIPANRIKEGSAFTLDEPGEIFYPIRPGEEFAHLDKVRNGKLAFRGDQWGVVVDELCS